jgi:YesN/AraC family two-component response regulator
MRRTQPEAVTMIITGYPAFETALEAIRQQVDDYIVKPADIPALVNAIEKKLAAPLRHHPLPPPKRVAMLLQENLERIDELWRSSLAQDQELAGLAASHQQRLQYLHGVMAEVIRAAQYYSGEVPPEGIEPSAEHIRQRDLSQYTASIVLAEFCRLRRVLAQIVQENLLTVNLSYVVPDLARVNESLDKQAQAAIAMFSEGSKTSRTSHH